MAPSSSIEAPIRNAERRYAMPRIPIALIAPALMFAVALPA